MLRFCVSRILKGGLMAENFTYDALVRQLEALESVKKALQKSESHLRTLVDTIPDLVWLKDPKGVYICCNKVFEAFFGAAESQIVGKTDYDFVDRELADFFRKNDLRAMALDGPAVNEERLTFARDGYHGRFETIKTPHEGCQRQPHRCAGHCQGYFPAASGGSCLKRDRSQTPGSPGNGPPGLLVLGYPQR